MTVFVTGVNGQLGHDVVKELLKRGHAAIGSGSSSALKERGSGSGQSYKGAADLKVFVTGVGGQLGHDVVNNLAARGHEAVGSDIQATYAGIQDNSDVVRAPYVQMDITDKDAVARTIEEIKPDAIVHCAT